jgi:8-oxo-dGTP pyrophosphatase MutT (NUDIX family)
MKAALKKLIGRLRLYSLAAGLYEAYRRVLRPHTHGALVALWHGQQLLLVQASYRHSLSLPGGGLAAGESARQAAVRELAEELGLRVAPQELGTPWGVSELTRGGRNTVWIFPLTLGEEKALGEPPALQPDGLEIVACHWLSREQALERPLLSHLRDYLAAGIRPCSR